MAVFHGFMDLINLHFLELFTQIQNGNKQIANFFVQF